MATETLHLPASVESSLPRSARHKLLGSLPTHAVDAIDNINHMLNAYRCVEDLLMPITRESRRPEVTDRQLHALISVLNDALTHRIQRAKRMARRVQKRANHLTR